MPYISVTRRLAIDEGESPKCAGELNYLMFTQAMDYFEGRGANYQAWNDIVGAMELSKLELYRRCITLHENAKIAENGDIL